MCEVMMMGDYGPLGSETEYFWRNWEKKWTLCLIPDPKYPDPIRHAILACIVEELVTAFNWRLALGMRRNGQNIRRQKEGDPWPPYTPVVGPDWTQFVPPIEPDMLKDLPPELVNERGKLVLEERGCNEVFSKRNIITNVGWFYTV
ncbi:5262317d-ab68-429d-b6cf-7f3398749a7a-CDS [Sclerotinia trifoliorum]|uniref:5262317d-ab68-429d-b6cf-7f3398749a7a-CDS n=1 Tax=Sclerotinia trifoliorum TaxID=28548 RepID=A0A8H2VXK1_9HELO|nr:5262317d-ab68-429d-b6cf-7f3398749a7a-CDS [Sclerotinia trifoliorum]